MVWAGSWALIDGKALEQAAYYNIGQGKVMSSHDLIYHNHRELAHRINAGLEGIWFLQSLGIVVSSLTLIQLTYFCNAICKSMQKDDNDTK